MWWYPLVDMALIVGGSLAVFMTFLRKIPWFLVAIALGGAFWFYYPGWASLSPKTKPAPVVRNDPPSPAPVTAAAQAATTYAPPPAYGYNAPPAFVPYGGGGRTVTLFPHAFGGHHR